MAERVRAVWFTSLTPKAVGPVVLVASKPSARLVTLLPARRGVAYAPPSLIPPPVLWSPTLAPSLVCVPAQPYHPSILPANPSPPTNPAAIIVEAKAEGVAGGQRGRGA